MLRQFSSPRNTLEYLLRNISEVTLELMAS